jgi:hypothetical protein
MLVGARRLHLDRPHWEGHAVIAVRVIQDKIDAGWKNRWMPHVTFRHRRRLLGTSAAAFVRAVLWFSK